MKRFFGFSHLATSNVHSQAVCCDMMFVSGFQLEARVHRHSGPSTVDDRRLLEDGVGVQLSSYCHGHEVYGGWADQV